jgi:predicted DNA-binding protein with PD1-like motif
VGSLQDTKLPLANRSNHTAFTGKQEIVSMMGTIDANGAHLHLSISDGNGKTTGGHLVEGCKIYTTVQIAIGVLPDLRFSREKDSASLYEELKIDSVPEK